MLLLSFHSFLLGVCGRTMTVYERIVHLFKEGNSPNVITKMLGVSRSTVYYTMNRFRAIGTCSPRPKTGRPRTVSNPKVIKCVRERLRRNPRRSMRKMAKELNIAPTTLRYVAKNVLKLHAFKLKKRHFLDDDMKATRFVRTKQILKQHDFSKFNNFVFTDEKIFTIRQKHNSHNDRVWCTDPWSMEPEKKIVQKKQGEKSVMVWAGIHRNGKTPLIFLEKGVKVNQKVYQEKVLEDVLLPWSRKEFENEHWVFTQDSAPAHRAKKTQEWLERNVPEFIPYDKWPSNSPDLNPMDYSVWSILEQRVCCKRYTLIKSLQHALQVEWERISRDTLSCIVNNFRLRLKACIKAKGGHIEM